MIDELKMDRVALRNIWERKERKRRQRNLPPPSAEDKQERFLRFLLQSAMRDALGSLSAEDRELIQRVVIDREKTVAEIAESLGVARSTVHRRIARAIEKLHEFLKDLPIVQAILLGTRKR